MVTGRRYGQPALDVIEGGALYADRVDWPSTRARILAAAGRVSDPVALHEQLRAVVRQTGGPHSGLVVPGVAGRPTPPAVPVRVAAVVDGAEVLVLPACMGDRRLVRSYAAAGGQALRALPQVRGWVLDLRSNNGGRCPRADPLSRT